MGASNATLAAAFIVLFVANFSSPELCPSSSAKLDL